MLRVDPDETDALVAKPHASRMVMRGREMDGWLHLDDAAIEADAVLHAWVARGVSYAGSLPSK